MQPIFPNYSQYYLDYNFCNFPRHCAHPSLCGCSSCSQVVSFPGAVTHQPFPPFTAPSFQTEGRPAPTRASHNPQRSQSSFSHPAHLEYHHPLYSETASFQRGGGYAASAPAFTPHIQRPWKRAVRPVLLQTEPRPAKRPARHSRKPLSESAVGRFNRIERSSKRAPDSDAGKSRLESEIP